MERDDLRARAAAFRRDHPAPAARAVDAGEVLARAARQDGTELRVSLHTFEGKPFVRVGVWQSPAPDAFPVKGRSASVRVREFATLADGIARAMDAVDGRGAEGRR